MSWAKPAPPALEDNHLIPARALDEIADAIAGSRPAIFHGGCQGCVWRHMNTTHEGIVFCRGCTYFAWNRDLPDKSRTHSKWSL